MAEMVHRNPRVRPPGPASTSFELASVPALEPPATFQPVQLLVPLLGSFSILAYGLLAHTPVLLITGGIMVLASMASPLVLHRAAGRSRRSKVEQRRRRYRAHLTEVTEAVERAKADRAAQLADAHPAPGDLDGWLRGRRLWERRRDDEDLLDVRVGTADLVGDLTLTRQGTASFDAEPDAELVAEADALARAVGTLESVPLVVRLAGEGVVSVTGERRRGLGLVRAALLELALTCAPEDLCLVVAFPPGDGPTWDWAKWLPHTSAAAAGLRGSAGDRLLATTPADLERILGALVPPRLRAREAGGGQTSRHGFAQVLVVLDRYDPLSELGRSGALAQVLAQARDSGVTVLALCDAGAPVPTQTSVLVDAGGPDAPCGGAVRRLGRSDTWTSFAPVSVGLAEAERLARGLAPKRLVAGALHAGRGGGSRLADLLPPGVLDTPRWTERAGSDLLRIPFAVSADGSPVELDLKESAEGGHGPHGLVVGAVGSGKSELLRTVVSGLAATHGSDDVELAFADFKGGLTFSLLQQLPHCSGMITNLADDLTLVDRMKAALTGELERRQEMLRAAGADVQKIGQYRALRRARPDLSPMPYLVVVVDEFGELLEARPDVLEVLLSIGRTGRSLGVHLVLASQRLEPGRTRGLDSYLGYRICLRTFTADDSVTVLGSRAAADLPALPGHGYLRTGTGLTRFLAATVSDSVRASTTRAVRRFDATGCASDRRPVPQGDAPDSDLAVFVQRVRQDESTRRRPPLWLPPLPRPDQPDALRLDDERLDVPASAPGRGLPVAVGLVDLPAVRRQSPLTFDPAHLDGHLLVVGAPRAGKSSVLTAYALQAARAHPASLLQFHVADLGGGALAPLAGLPNVGAYADGQDADAVRRVVLELERLVDDRARGMRRHGVHSMAGWRERVAAGVLPGPAHTVLLLDQLVSFRERFADLDAAFGRLLAEGPSAGVHVAMTSTRWAELPPKRLEQVSTRIELRLNDPMESQHGRVAAAALPAGVPGRALVSGGRLAQVAAAGGTGDAGAAGLTDAVERAVSLAGRRWPGVTAPPLRRLADVTVQEWRAAALEAAGRGDALLGLAESGFEPVVLAPSAGIPVLAYGDPGSGRSRLLARLLAEAAALPAPHRPRVYVLDYLGALLDRCPDTSAVVASAFGPQEAIDVLAGLTAELDGRLAVLAAARRAGSEPPRSAPTWLVADDYELVHAAARPGLVGDLANLVPYASRLGLGIVLNQAANGSGARVDPLVRKVLEASPWHLQFSVESRLELLLKGGRGAPLPAGQAVLTRPGRADAVVSVLPPMAEPGAAQSRPSEPSEPPEPSSQSESLRAQIRLVS